MISGYALFARSKIDMRTYFVEVMKTDKRVRSGISLTELVRVSEKDVLDRTALTELTVERAVSIAVGSVKNAKPDAIVRVWISQVPSKFVQS